MKFIEAVIIWVKHWRRTASIAKLHAEVLASQASDKPWWVQQPKRVDDIPEDILMLVWQNNIRVKQAEGR